MHVRPLFSLASFLYALMITLWLLLRLLYFDQLWWLALLNSYATYLFLPLPVLLLAGLWWRERKLLLGLLVPLVAFGALFGALFLPSLVAAPQAGHTLTAMTFNVLTRNKDVPAIVAAVRSAAPDIVGFQELTRARARGLVAALGTEYPYHTLVPAEQVRGVGLISRFPIETVAPLLPLDTHFVLHVTLRVAATRLHVFVAHLAPNGLRAAPLTRIAALARTRYAVRAAEATLLAHAIGGLHEPALLLCDCNLTDTSEAYTHLARIMSDSFRAAGWGLGHSSFIGALPLPAQRIDYVWHSTRLHTLRAYVGTNRGGSDHLPVVAVLQLIE